MINFEHMRKKLKDFMLLLAATVIVLVIFGMLCWLRHIGNETNNLKKHRTNYEWIQTRR